jgi:hypothetical protein
MLEMLGRNDLVIGERDMTDVPLQRRISNGFAAWAISRIAGKSFKDVLCGFRAVKKGRYLDLGMETNAYEFESEMVIRAAVRGFRIGSMPVKVRYFSGASGISPLHSARVTIYIISQLIKSWVRG